jgi:ribosomal protein S18 acetylase RimI-like enzyme
MKVSEDSVEIVMYRDLEEGRTSPPVPEGYSLRWYRPGDEDLWFAIQSSTGIYGSISLDLFTREFGDDLEMLSARQCYLDDSRGRPVGTATAWVAGPGHGKDEGRVHWVAVIPEVQRRGLGTYLTRVVCGRLRELGAHRAYLTTGSRNVAAVQFYLGLGFLPQARSEQELRVWWQLVQRVEDRFRALFEGFAV